MPADPFTCPADELDEVLLRQFVGDAMASRLQAESLVLEFKAKNDGDNVIGAVAAMSNTDGGLVFVGIDEKAPDPFVGITAGQVDSIVQRLRALLPSAMPEVVPVALGNTDSAVLVLRVDADQVDHPVVFNGRVMVRVPGHSVGARRDEIVALTQRQQDARPAGVYGPQVDVANIQMWEESESLSVEVRVHARFTLPRHVSGREWLGTAAIRSAIDALEECPIPSRLCSEHLRSHEVNPSNWVETEVASLRSRFRSDRNPAGHRGRPEFTASALTTFGGRTLDVVLSIDVGAKEPEPASVGTVERLRELLLAGATGAVAVGQACAAAMGARDPLEPPWLSAWIGGDPGLESMQVDKSWLVSDAHSPRRDWRFTAMSPRGTDAEHLDVVVKLWLVPLIFEFGALGFEEHLEGLALPKWTRDA